MSIYVDQVYIQLEMRNRNVMTLDTLGHLAALAAPFILLISWVDLHPGIKVD